MLSALITRDGDDLCQYMNMYAMRVVTPLSICFELCRRLCRRVQNAEKPKSQSSSQHSVLRWRQALKRLVAWEPAHPQACVPAVGARASNRGL